MYKKVKETVSYLISKGFIRPDYAIVLGTGLGNLADHMDVKLKIPYSEIPNFPISTVKGHTGALILGDLGGKSVIAMQGRFHYYEGWDMKEVTFPIRVMNFLGVKNLIVSNASGGVNDTFKVGDIMIIEDHINMMPIHPLRGENDERFGSRFVDMHEPYDLKMISAFEEIADRLQIKIQKGVYLSLQGPTFETPAEYRMVKLMGADAVGMSTVPEVIVAKHMGIKCFGISVITDLGIEGHIEEVSHEAVQIAARSSEKNMTKLIAALINSYPL